MSKTHNTRAHEGLPWSSKIAASESELFSSLANVKGDLFLSPAATCIGVIKKKVGKP